MVRQIIIVVILLNWQWISAQPALMDSVTLALYPTYFDLSEALQNPDEVIKLNLRKKKLKEFPKEVLLFKNLQYLDLSRNDIKTLPDSIVVLTQLQYLIVSRTGLETLPRNIGGLKNLRHLNVNQNSLGVLPYSFGDLENLEVADLWSNELEYFPESMSKLKNLVWMDLRNILIPAANQEAIQAMLPDTKIEFSPPCNCSW
ncbi:MAG: leucine-rich repeat domain-containing protein [bacterium]|nr:leucine-rich repeat domain-containing protein [bacterium]